MPVKLNGSTSGYVQLQAAAVAANNTLTLPNSGTTLISDATLPATAPTNGQIPIGNGTTYVPATITAGSGISVTNGAGSISIAATSTGPSPTTLTYNSSATWTKATDVPAGCTMALIEVWGAGGGAARNASISQQSGGGGGSYSYKVVPISSLGATETVTVGAGGLGATTSANGGAGGSSSFGSWSTAYGGAGGSTSGTNTIYYSTSNVAGGGATNISGQFVGCASDGTTNYANPQTYNGGGGATSVIPASPSAFGGGGGGCNGSAGASSAFGGAGGNSAATPGAGAQPGGGGAGSTSANTNGGNGGAGRVKITMW